MERLQSNKARKGQKLIANVADERYRVFANAFLKTLNATEAAKVAGYNVKTAASQGSLLLNNPKVKAILEAKRQRLEEKTEITVERCLNELAKVGFGTLKNYFRIDHEGQPEIDLANLTDDEWAALGEITTEVFWDGKGDQARDVKRTKIKLHDKIKPLELMMKHLGGFDRHRGGGADDEIDQPPVREDTLKIGNAHILIQNRENNAQEINPAGRLSAPLDVSKAK